MMKRIALTFDDGPNTVTTPQVLDILEEQGIVASFFLIADNINEASARIAQRALALGCELNNHSKTHSRMSGMTAEEIRAEISRCTGQIIALAGRAPRFFRPPYIDVSRTLYDEVGLGFICGAGCKDWLPETSAEERVRLTLENARDGEIILLHDSLGNVNTVEALREIIPVLKEQDYSFVTCGQLFDECGVVPKKGWLYSNVYQKGADDRL